ncbi:MAG: sensor domain-containing diguanylate cyclase [Ruminiclostridium sp.]|nr:sensor domain-containing diguanylate cyclase [Ruminiclostridium sp.]
MKNRLIISKLIFALLAIVLYMATADMDIAVRIAVGVVIAAGFVTFTVLEYLLIKKLERETEHRLLTSDTLVECIKALSDDDEVDKSMDYLLRIVTEYYGADRAFTFEIDYEAESTSNTYEYAAENVTKEIDKLQDVPIESIDCFLEAFKQKGTLFISDVDEEVDKETWTYNILAMQNIQRLIAVPLIEDGEIIGFMGVDNPTVNYRDLSLLSSVTVFIMETLEKRERKLQLERMSFEDGLTKLNNRNKFNQNIEKYTKNPPSALGVAYFDLNGLKRMNDEYGHGAGDRFILNSASTIRYVFGKDTYRIGGDEFAVICANMSEEEFNSKMQEEKNYLCQNQLSISIGCSWRGADNDINAQLREADDLMYADKRAFYEQSGMDRRKR